MIEHMDVRNLSYANYGCAGRGNVDPYTPTIGRPVDVVNKAIKIRKHCIQCASQKFGLKYQPLCYI